jgi:hypothetical protein
MKSQGLHQGNVLLLWMNGRAIVIPGGAYYKGRTGFGYSGMIGVIHSTVKVTFIPAGVHHSHWNGRKVVKIRFGQTMNGES